MTTFEKILRIAGPTLLCGALGILVMSDNGEPPKTQRVTDGFVSWISDTFGAVPAGLMFVMIGVAWSMSAYYRISGRR